MSSPGITSDSWPGGSSLDVVHLQGGPGVGEALEGLKRTMLSILNLVMHIIILYNFCIDNPSPWTLNGFRMDKVMAEKTDTAPWKA